MNDPTHTAVRDAIARVREAIASACGRAGRAPDEVLVVAVSKGVPLDLMRVAAAAGLTDLAENRAAEAESKFLELGPDITRHFIGRIQSNKAGKIAGFADWVHSLDRPEAARRIDARANRPIKGLIEVNITGERSKAGVDPDEAYELANHLLDGGRPLDHLTIEGLMAMAPQSYDAARSRPYFRRMARLRDELQQRFPSIRHLSMGMSQDYEVAVEEGATMVRLGNAIFEGRASR